MPRVLPGAPALAVSPDGATVAMLSDGRLALVGGAERGEIAEATVAVEGESELGFVGSSPRLLSVTRGSESTTLFAWSTPGLEVIAKLEIPSAVRALAFVGERVLVVSSDGESPRVITLTTKLLVAEPISLRGPVHLAAGAPEERLLVESKGQLEFWDPVLKRALFRLNLPLPPSPGAIGFTGRGRLLWIAGKGAEGRFDVFRFSDGRKQLSVDLGGEILAVEGSAVNNRVVVALRQPESTTIDLTHLDLGLRERLPLELDHPLGSFVVLEGDKPQIVAAAAGAPLAFVPLAKASGRARGVPMIIAPPPPGDEASAPRFETTPASGPPTVEEAPAGGGVAAPAARGVTTAADRFAAWRSRLHASRPAAAAAEFAPVEASPDEEPPVDAAEEREEVVDSPAPRPAVKTTRAAQTRWSSSRAPVRRAASATPGAQRTPMRDAAPSEESSVSWRSALVAWGVAALTPDERPAIPPPLDDAAPVNRIAERYGLEPPAVRALAILYAGWLLGSARDGLPAAAVARAVGEGGDWIESLGRGELARQGLARARNGRLRLRPEVGRYLDGHATRVHIVRPSDPLEAPPAIGTSVVVLGRGEALSAVAAQLAERLRRDVAPISLDAGAPPRRVARRLRRELFEARALGAVPLVAWPSEGQLDDRAWLESGAALIAVAEACPPSLEHLPKLRSNAD